MLNKNNLKFSCQRCGYCCTFPDGYVWVSIEEIKKIADYLNLELNAFGSKYLRRINVDQYSLLEKSNHDCIMYQDKGYSIYSVRPIQCKTFPFWPENLKSKKAWEEVKKTCKGIL